MEAYDNQDSQQFRYIIELIKRIENNRGKQTSFINKENNFKRITFFLDRKNKNRKIIVFLSKKITNGKRKSPRHVFKITDFIDGNNEILFESLRKENQKKLVYFFEEKFIDNS